MSHWYDQEGNPRYEYEGKDGKLHPTTLRQARVHGWVPSATTIWKDTVAEPGLNKWINEQHMNALWTECHSADNLSTGGGYPEFEKLAKARYNKKQQEVMGRGTTVHNSLDIYFSGGNPPAEHKTICENLRRVLDVKCGNHNDWVAEKSFSHSLGYGGAVDLHNDDWVVDFKTKEFPPEPNVKKMVYNNHGAQLAAYNQGLGGVPRRLLNLYIDVKSGAILEWEHEEADRFREMFNHALELWKLIKKYDPSFFDSRIM